jgi:hypothetical protein
MLAGGVIASISRQPSARGLERGPESSEVGRPKDDAILCGDVYQIEVDSTTRARLVGPTARSRRAPDCGLNRRV